MQKTQTTDNGLSYKFTRTFGLGELKSMFNGMLYHITMIVVKFIPHNLIVENKNKKILPLNDVNLCKI